MKRIDVVAAIGAVVREVGDVAREGKTARVVRATRVYDGAVEDVWDAITSRERIPRWFMPVEGDLKLGGKYQLVGNAGGTITTCEPPRRLGLTWEMRGDVSWVDVVLEAVAPEKTRLVLEHTAIVNEELWGQFGPGAVGLGWDLGLLGLGMHFDTKGAGITDEGKAWAASEEGVRFQRLASDEWCKASIAAGTDPTKAREAADRTTAAYTGSA